MLALGAGCGGGGDDTSTTVTKAEFTKAVNTICQQIQKDRFDDIGAYDQKLISSGEKPESVSGLERKMAAVLLPSMRKQKEELEEVAVPEASQPKYDQMMDSLDQGIAKLEEEKVLGLRKAPHLEAFEKEAAALGLSCSA